MAHSGVSAGPGPERRSSSPFSASASCAKGREAKSSPKSKEKIIPFHISAIANSDGGLHGKAESLSPVKVQASARNRLVDTSVSLTARSCMNRMSAGSIKEHVSNSGSVQAAEEQTRSLSQPAGRKVESLMDISKTKSPSHTRVPQRQKCKLKQGGSVCSYTKPQSAMKKKKRKMGMYSLVPKKKTKVLKQQEKNVEPVDVMEQSEPAADEVIPESLCETKSGDEMVEKNDLLMEVKLGEGCCLEYTELALDCLDLKAQEELLLPRLSDVGATEKDLAEELPLCCCRMETPHSGGSLSIQDQTCMATERVDGMLNRCHRRVIKQEMMRPSNAVHLLVLCEDHRAGMVKHQCCPGCGLFCRVGTFLECRPYGNISHRFHRDCASMLKGRMFCPHCGEDAYGSKEVTVPKPDRSPSILLSKPGLSLPAGSLIPNLPSASTAPIFKILRAKKTTEPQRTRDNDGSKRERLPKESLESILMALDNENLNLKNVRYPSKQLYISAKQGDIQKVIHLLVEGKDPNYSMEGQHKRTPLHASAAEGHQEICHILVQAGANLDVYDVDQRTPLMAACQNNHLDTVKYLLRAGAAVSCKDLKGFTCLHLSAKLGHFDIVQHLLSKASKYINCQDKGGWTPITWAIEYKHKELVRLLLARGADVNMRDKEENVCLHWAALVGCDDIAQILLDARCDLSAVNIHGDSSLHVAARENHPECVMLFLSRGADCNQRNNEGQTPLDCSVDGSKVWTILNTNKKLTNVWRGRDSHGERLLSRDISRGYESTPIACVNGVDCEPCPQNFKYIPDNCVTSTLNIDKDITHLQHCSCTDDCSSSTCICGQLSQRCWYDNEGRLPLDFCQREPPVLFECNHACSCWRTCRNRVVQNGIKVRLQLFRTPAMGWGVKTMQDIPHGTFICEYVGEIIPDTEADKRENDSFLFTLDNKVGDMHCIDSRRFGNIGRFINHFCEPNLTAVRVFTMHQDLRFPRIAFFSRKPVKAGDQIGFDYGDNFWNVKRKYFSCQCGSSKCRHSSVSL